MKTLKNKDLEITIKNSGAELTSIKNGLHEYLWQGDPKFWGRQSPVLFPIVGPLKDNQYTIDGQPFSLAQHGFARDCDFVLTNEQPNALTYTLVANEKTRKLYPYRFQLDITYTLVQNTVSITYEVTNHDKQPLYYSIGGHPAFNVTDLDRYHLEIPGKYDVLALKDGWIDSTLCNQQGNIPCSNDFFAKGAYIYQPHASGDRIIRLMVNEQPYIQMEYYDFKLMGLWTPEGKNAPFLCLEPWNGVADFAKRANQELSHKDYIETLAPTKKATATYKITFYKEKINE